jgi:leucyl-tRNA synthetase
MFPYPSGAGLHVGHIEGYTATDIFSRYSRMKGYQVLHPMGFDSFGLPAENYAIKTGVHPAISTEDAIKTFTAQMQSTGLSYDWDLVLAAHRPEYYRWTQWFFLFLYKRGLAYRKKQAVNWCPGLCADSAQPIAMGNRGGYSSSKDMEQWFFKITDYAERLLQDLDRLDWPRAQSWSTQLDW